MLMGDMPRGRGLFHLPLLLLCPMHTVDAELLGARHRVFAGYRP
jgi:hypothetical protein